MNGLHNLMSKYSEFYVKDFDLDCLNRSGVHLNKVGDSTFAKNIIEAIKRF